MNSGVLYLVATPIGNYDDITFRALEVLRSVDVIVFEERKEANRLLNHFKIEKAVESLNEHNELVATEIIISLLKNGKNIALISDCGTPLFSDPGQLLVKKCIDLKIKITPLPGASSLMPALTVSGFSIEQFFYYGWLSPKRERRISELQKLKRETRTFVIMDTPYRLVQVMRDINDVLGGNRKICVAFNLTLQDEEIFHGTAGQLFKLFASTEKKGEFVIVVDGAK